MRNLNCNLWLKDDRTLHGFNNTIMKGNHMQCHQKQNCMKFSKSENYWLLELRVYQEGFALCFSLLFSLVCLFLATGKELMEMGQLPSVCQYIVILILWYAMLVLILSYQEVSTMMDLVNIQIWCFIKEMLLDISIFCNHLQLPGIMVNLHRLSQYS